MRFDSEEERKLFDKALTDLCKMAKEHKQMMEVLEEKCQQLQEEIDYLNLMYSNTLR